MSCKHPLKGFVIPSKIADSGYEIKVQGYETKSMVLRAGRWFGSDHIDPVGEQIVTEFIDIPCGKCLGCRLDYSRQWADRCLMELEEHESAYFLTLTYDDDHLPFGECYDADDVLMPFTYVDEETGECGRLPTLRKRDVQLFHKRLRERLGQKIRYFTAGEYGDNTGRPHYHSIEFGLEIPDLKVYSIKDGYNLYESALLDEIWGLGKVIIGDCTWETCAYTARYVMKKWNGKLKEWYDVHNVSPEFILMSRRPGLGRAYYEKHGKELFTFRSVPVSDKNGGRMVSSTNRYFDKLLLLDDASAHADLKKKRIEAAKHTEFLRDAQTSMKKLDRLLVEEEVLAVKTKALKRIDN